MYQMSHELDTLDEARARSREIRIGVDCEYLAVANRRQIVPTGSGF